MKRTASRQLWLLRRSATIPMFGLLLVSACSVSTQREIEIGTQYAAEINRQLPIITDATVQRSINLIGNEIARHGGRGLTYQFFVVDAKPVNAFAVPGGFVYVNRGLIERTQNFSELAGVLAHEIGHVEERHSAEQMERMQSANLGLNVAYILLGRSPGGLERAAVGLGGGLFFARYSRQAENEADRTAIPLLLAAGIDPSGLVTLFEKLLAEQKRSPGTVEQWFSTHPTTQDRIDATQKQINRLSPAQRQGLRTASSEYNTLKNRLAQLPPARDVARR